MKKTFLIALTAAFLAGPLLACDGMKDGSYPKADGKAEASPARMKHAKHAKAKASKPVAQAPGDGKKI